MTNTANEKTATVASAVEDKTSPGPGHVKIVLGIGIVLVLLALFVPPGRDAREAARRTRCRNHLKDIAVALMDYEAEHGALPPAHTIDTNGELLHSWRTLILPYLGQEKLYNTIDLTKPWNDPANAAAYETRLDTYNCPSTHLSDGLTTYMALTKKNCCFHPTRPRPLSEITDAASRTVMIVEVSLKKAVHWMTPQDIGPDFILQFDANTDFGHGTGMHLGIADGSVRFVSHRLSKSDRQAMVTIAGNDDHPSYEFGDIDESKPAAP